MSKYIAVVLTAAIATLAQAQVPTRTIEEKSFEVFDTGLEPMSCCTMSPATHEVGYWLSDTLFVVNALRDEPDANRRQAERLMLVDADTRQITTLVAEGRLQCWNRELRVVSINPGYKLDEYHYMRLEIFGRLEELPEKPDLNLLSCMTREYVKQSHGNAKYLSESDGYIQRYYPGKGSLENAASNATLISPGKPPKTLPVRVDEIEGGKAKYLAFMDKYLLNRLDSQGSSSTERRLAGLAWGDRPYDLTPYRLLARDGSIEEIPYPKILFEYGVRYFYELLPTRAGIVIDAADNGKGEHGLFLLQGERLIRFWGRPGLFSSGREGVSGTTLSPDGCKIAFRRFADWKLNTRKHITIINLCKEA